MQFLYSEITQLHRTLYSTLEIYLIYFTDTSSDLLLSSHEHNLCSELHTSVSSSKSKTTDETILWASVLVGQLDIILDIYGKKIS